jgi:hypothetical protein
MHTHTQKNGRVSFFIYNANERPSMRYARPQHDFESVSLVAEAEIDELLRHSRSVQAQMKRRTDGGALAEYELEKKLKERASRKGKGKGKGKAGKQTSNSSLMLPRLSGDTSIAARPTIQKHHSLQPPPKAGSLGEDQKFQCRDDIFALLDDNQAEEDLLYAQMQETSDEKQLSQLQKRIDVLRSRSSAQLLGMLKVYDPKASVPSPADIEAGASATESPRLTQAFGGSGRVAKKGGPKRKKKAALANLSTEFPSGNDDSDTAAEQWPAAAEEWPTDFGSDQGARASGMALSAAEEYLFDRSDGYVAFPTSHEDLQNAIDESQTPIGQLNSHRPVTRSGIGIDRGLSGIVGDHIAPIDTDFPSLRVYEREAQKDAKYMANTGGKSRSKGGDRSGVQFTQSQGGGSAGKKFAPTPHPQAAGSTGGFADAEA